MADQPLKQQVDPFFGEEPLLGPPGDERAREIPPPVVTLGQGEKPPEAPAATPPAPAEPPTAPPEPPEVQAADQEAAAAIQAEPAPEGKKPARAWSRIRQERDQAKRERDSLQQRLADMERAQREQQARFDEAQRLIQGREREARPWQPGQQGQPTQEDLTRLRDEDPILYGHVVAEMAQREAQTARQEAQLLRRQQVVQSHIMTARQAHGDYDQAVTFLEQREVARWKAAGVPDDQIQPLVQARADALINAALAKGMSVGEAAYAVALAEGWQTPAAAPPPAAVPAVPAPGNGQTPEEKVAQSRARTQLAEGSLGNVPSGSTGARPTLSREEFLKLSEAQMEKLSAESPGWEQLVQP